MLRRILVGLTAHRVEGEGTVADRGQKTLWSISMLNSLLSRMMKIACGGNGDVMARLPLRDFVAIS